MKRDDSLRNDPPGSKSISEFDLIERIRRVSVRRPDRVALGVGDDGAVLRGGGSGCVVVCDALIEDVHFRRAWSSMADVAFKSIAVNVSDLAAMGTSACAAFVALGVPARATAREFAEVVRGLGEASHAFDCEIAGGDTTRAPVWTFAVTLVGDGPGPLRRGGAQPGDGLWVTGTIGDAGFALSWLRAAPDDAWKRSVPEGLAERALERHRRGAARTSWGTWLAAHGGTCGIDISDGLFQDVRHLARASGCAVELRAESIPVCEAWRYLPDLHGADAAVQRAGAAGEDFELAFAWRGSHDPDGPSADGVSARRIGDFVDGPPGQLTLFDAAGQPIALDEWGHRHF